MNGDGSYKEDKLYKHKTSNKYDFLHGIIVLFFYMSVTSILKHFQDLRIVTLLVVSVLFILQGIWRYRLLLAFFEDRKKAFQRQLLENNSIFLGLIILYASEGFVYAHSGSINDISFFSYRALLFILAFACLFPAVYTSYEMGWTSKKKPSEKKQRTSIQEVSTMSIPTYPTMKKWRNITALTGGLLFAVCSYIAFFVNNPSGWVNSVGFYSMISAFCIFAIPLWLQYFIVRADKKRLLVEDADEGEIVKKQDEQEHTLLAAILCTIVALIFMSAIVMG